ncbi:MULTISPECIES: sigma-70 family RNA polymerase sigma factor [unclassified Pseudodesulfovibrio]|uniref:RNA polymerase sigma factor n=1 Tax=unclassified Pseudodesulfovibrio TaxID=2661612 RepID=UPI000FEC1FD7|nr:MULTISPECIES: sigma-70 family RNA polymerase sigma factor [unclassified Pseudodesulfovibrio]MCJ2163581.1 sigma-70 family RNA polymerase sigma factor [Pseudodesulfovibrio sp. S3-i]RWU06815.1 sigma-70 family RNA polymerase sigma factor [Pseudodesulfovibrio sp. S3]
MKEKREADIVREVLLGKVQSFGVLVQEYQRPVYNLMLRMVGDEHTAADLAQEAFTRAYEKLGAFTVGKRFFPWLYSVSLNVARDWLRKNGRDKLLFVEDAAVMVRVQDRPDDQAAMHDRLDGEKAFAVVLRLDPKYREALMLRYKYDFSMKEIASTLGITVSGAKMRVSRGLDLVRQQFDGGEQ